MLPLVLVYNGLQFLRWRKGSWFGTSAVIDSSQYDAIERGVNKLLKLCV